MMGENEVIASWSTSGIPASIEMPKLHFTHANSYSLYAEFEETLTFENILEVVSSTVGTECSFAGGCTYAIESKGLYATLLNSANTI